MQENIGDLKNAGSDVIKTDQKLIESAVDFKAVFEAMPEASLLVATDAPNYTILAATYNYMQLSGKNRDEIIGKDIFKVFLKNPQEANFTGEENLNASFQKVILEKKWHQLLVQRYDISDQDGEFSEYYWDVVNKPVLGERDQVLYIIHTVKNITNKVKANQEREKLESLEQSNNLFQQTLAEKEQSLKLAIEISGLGVYEIDIKTDKIEADARFYEIYGVHGKMSREEILEIYHPDDLIHRNMAHKTALETSFLDYETRILKKDNLINWVRVKGTFLYDESGEPSKLLGVVQDITEQKQWAQSLENKVQERTKELAETNLQLQQSNADLNQFAYIASHDLQEPLRKIRTYAQMLEANLGHVEGKVEVSINKIQNSAERMQTLIKSVLSFSLLSKEKREFEKVDLNLTLNNVLSDYELLILQKDAKIIAESLPVIEAIPVQMNQLFTNLLSNALKFSSTERQPEISITSKKLSREEVVQYKELDKDKIYYLIEFKDNGIGFDQVYAQKIFSMFQRLHSKLEQGNGIGLAICKKIANNHCGTIHANSHINTSTSFIIIIPETQNK